MVVNLMVSPKINGLGKSAIIISQISDIQLIFAGLGEWHSSSPNVTIKKRKGQIRTIIKHTKKGFTKKTPTDNWNSACNLQRRSNFEWTG